MNLIKKLNSFSFISENIKANSFVICFLYLEVYSALKITLNYLDNYFIIAYNTNNSSHITEHSNKKINIIRTKF